MSLFFRPPPQQDASSLQPLTTIYLSPLSKASHTLAVSGDELVDFLSLQPIIRTGDVLTLPSSQQHDAQAGENKAELVAFRVVMTEPGRMGVFVGRERDQEDEEDAGEEEELEETEVVVGPWVSPDGKGNDDGLIIDSSLDPQHARYPSSESSSSSSDKTIQPFPPSPPLSIEHSSPPTSNSDDDDDDEDFEISSSFLQSALLGPSPFDSASSSAGSSPYPHTPPDPLSFSPSTLSSSSACLDPAPLSSTLRASFPARPLVRQGKRRENCREAGALEKNNVVWVKTKMLGEVGAFDGDWVALRAGSTSTGVFSDDWRLVKILAHDGDDPDPFPASVQIPPLLLHNLLPLSHPNTSSSSSAASQTQVQILPTPFPPSSSASASALPPLPTATSLTLARLSSPAANDKRLQSQVLRGLRAFFEREGRDAGSGGGLGRVMKVGDLVGFGVDEFAEEEEAGEEGEPLPEGEEGRRGGEESRTTMTMTTTTVFFLVTHLELLPPPKSSSVNGSSWSSSQSWMTKAARGDFGARVDPSVTKLVQAGVKAGRGVGGSFGESVGVHLPISPESSPRAVLELRRVLEASLLANMSSYELRPSVLLKGARGCGKRTIVRSVAAELGVGVMEISCFDLVQDTDIKTEGTVRARFDRASSCSPCVLLLRHVEALARKGQALETGKEPHIAKVLQECIESLSSTWESSGYPVIVIGTTSDPEKVPLGILACFKHDIAIEAPDERERLQIIRSILSQTSIAADVDLESIAVQTAALVAQDLVSLVQRASSAAVSRISGPSSSLPLSQLSLSGLSLIAADFATAIDAARSAYSESIGAPKIPNVSWDDVGGLASVKGEILDTIELPLKRPELFGEGLKKRSGILLYGPPGTGKTLLAKAVATSCNLNFFSVKGPELLNMYIGESEANVRRVFQRARDAKPCVIFFDELDSVAPKRGNQGDSGGVMDRIVSQLLAELDGMTSGKSSADVFVIGATNRPDLLDPALLRPGRFDRMLYLGLSDTHQAQLNILEALTRKFKLEPNLDLATVAEQCPFNYTGADFYALCSDAMLKAMSRKAEEVDQRIASINAKGPDSTSPHPFPLTPQYYLAELATPQEIDVRVGLVDFQAALDELVPSVSEQEILHYKSVQQQFSAPPPAASAVPLTVADEGEASSRASSSASQTQITTNGKGKGKARASS